MTANLASLRIEAEALAKALPRFSASTNAASAAQLGSAARRRAGTGEDFWEYRRYRAEDDVSRIDWRRSAQGDTLFVRETELETARNFYLYADPHAGFDWSGDEGRITKADRARIIMMAIGSLLSREGERVGVLGSGTSAAFGKRALERVYRQLASPEQNVLTPPKQSGTAVIASDFYDPAELWKERLAPIAAKCRDGVLLAISDPVETDFPFQGRVRLSRPGTTLQRILGRAETLQDEYTDKLAENRAAMRALASDLGWRFMSHTTGEPALNGGSALRQALIELGAMT